MANMPDGNGRRPTHSLRGLGCLCGVLGSLFGLLAGIAIDMAEAARMRAEGLTVDFLPAMPIIGLVFGGCLGLPFGTILARSIRNERAERSGDPPREQPPPNLLRSLALSWAKDGNFNEAIRWQVEAVRLAPPEREADFRAELENYRKAAQDK